MVPHVVDTSARDALTSKDKCAVPQFAKLQPRPEVHTDQLHLYSVDTVQSLKLPALPVSAVLKQLATAVLKHLATAVLKHLATAALKHLATAVLKHLATAVQPPLATAVQPLQATAVQLLQATAVQPLQATTTPTERMPAESISADPVSQLPLTSRASLATSEALQTDGEQMF